MDKFKLSKKSICHKCINIDEVCDMRVSISCGTDSKVAASFVETCSSYNKTIGESAKESGKSISVGYRADSRVEMMGGGHTEPGKK